MLEALRKRVAMTLLKTDGGILNPFQILSTSPADIAVYADMTVRKATREGYKISVYVYRSVRTIVQAASAIPWVVQDKDGEPIENHEFTRVWSRPNPEFSGQDNMEFIIAHQLLVGNSLIQPLIVRGRPREFWVVMPDLVRPVPSDKPGEWLKGWQLTTQTGEERLLPPQQFVHFMQMDPGNPYWGTSPLMAAARTIDTDNEAQDTQKISMQNRATPDGVFTHAAVLGSEQFEEARRQVRENFLDKSRRREPWVLGAGADWKQMSMTPVEMDFIASRLHNKRDIAGAFGISPIFLGDLEQSSYNNMVEARKALYEDVVIPLLDDIKSTLNLKIAPMYGDVTIAYDTSKVAALREDYTKKVEQAKNLFGMGVPFDQINTRLEMGFDEFPGWGNGYLPLTLLPTGSAPPEEESTNRMSKALNLDSEEQKTTHWKRIDRRRVAWWGVVNKKVEPLYHNEGKAVLKAIEGKPTSQLVSTAGKTISKGRAEWEKTLTAISAALIEDFGNEIAEDLGAEKSDNLIMLSNADADLTKYLATGGVTVEHKENKWAFNPMSAAARAWIIKNGAASVTSILATDLDDVKRIILLGLDENLSTVQISRNLKQFYTDRSSFKAIRVARTEVSHSSGFGQREAAKQSGIVKTKSWISSRDDRVRDAHIAMDTEANHKVPLDKLYSDGSMYPGEQDIMCRCVESYQTGG